MKDLQEKAQFFAHYIYQHVLLVPSFKEVRTLHYFELESRSLEGALLLKPLSMISEKDRRFIRDCYNVHLNEERTEFKSLYRAHFAIAAGDYLRSKGYALSWQHFSVEDLIKMGWVKLVEK